MLYRRALRWLRTVHPSWRWGFWLTTILFAVFNVGALYGFILRPRVLDWPPWLIYGGLYPFFFWHTATIFMGLILLCVALVKLPAKILVWLAGKLPSSRRKFDQLRSTSEYQKFDAGRRIFLRRSVLALATVSFGGSAYGMLVGKPGIQLNEAAFRIPTLDPSLSGFTIGLISDIHSSVFMTRKDMEECVTLVNGLRCDLIVVVGDFVTSTVDEVYPFAEAFSELRAPLGVYGVTGNHEYYTENTDLVLREVDACGVKLLRDDKTVISKNGGAFYLIGVDDIGRSAGASIKIDKALGSTPLPIPKILLCHRPYFLANAAERNIDLVLSGHTHGGQIVLGKFGNTILAPASFASHYVWGTYTMGKTSMYVSRGIGTVGPPVRINCPPEITKITLLRPDASTEQNPQF